VDETRPYQPRERRLTTADVAARREKVGGIRASLAHVFGSDDLGGRNVVVHGAGGVGSPLAEHLANAGASVVVADIEIPRARTRLPVASQAPRSPPTTSSKLTATSTRPARSAAS
jgi:shikimate 5-dehydrogenase